MTNVVSMGLLFYQALPSNDTHRLWSC